MGWRPGDGPGFGDDLISQVVDYAIIRLDPEGVIQTWNLGAERVEGYTAAEAIGSSFSMFYTDEDRRAGLPLQLLAEARDRGRVEHTGWRVRKDGSRFWGDVVITARRSKHDVVLPTSPRRDEARRSLNRSCAVGEDEGASVLHPRRWWTIPRSP